MGSLAGLLFRVLSVMRARPLPLGSALAVLTAGASARAHTPAAPTDAAGGWSAEPLVLIPILVLGGAAYAAGITRLWHRAGIGRGVSVWRALAFACGFGALVLALVSPLDAAGDRSFALHMTQHMLLVVVAAPLLALGNAGVVLLTALPAGARLSAGRIIASRAVRRLRAILFSVAAATALHGVTLWIWHAPGLYEAALRDDLVHYLEHVTMLGTALLFWWSVTSARRRGPLGYGTGVAALFITMIHTGLLGILILLAPAVLYPSYAAGSALWSLSPLEDQQVAGIVMLLPGGIAYLAGGLVLLSAWLDSAARGQGAGSPALPFPARD